MNLSCPTCSQRLQVPDDAAGKKALCPKCGQKILVPTPRPTLATVKIEELGSTSSAVTAKPPIPQATFADPAKTSPTPQKPPTILERKKIVIAAVIASILICICIVSGLFFWVPAKPAINENDYIIDQAIFPAMIQGKWYCYRKMDKKYLQSDGSWFDKAADPTTFTSHGAVHGYFTSKKELQKALVDSFGK